MMQVSFESTSPWSVSLDAIDGLLPVLRKCKTTVHYIFQLDNDYSVDNKREISNQKFKEIIVKSQNTNDSILQVMSAALCKTK